MTIVSFTDLEIYQKSYKASLDVVRKVIPQLPPDEKFNLIDQMRRSSMAVPALIAEGYAKKHQYGNWKRYLSDAIGECNELIVHLSYCRDLYSTRIDQNLIVGLIGTYDVIGKQIYRLNEAWKKSPSSPTQPNPLLTSHISPQGMGILLVLLSGLIFTAIANAADPFQESNGQVVMEAENSDAKISRSSKDWTLLTTTTGYSGAGYLQVLPNTGVTISTGYNTTSPELQYRINFVNTGTYYIWIRGRGPTTNDDSLHAGIDSTAPVSADKISGFPNSWTWSRSTMDGAPATIVVSAPGVHTLNLWMQEDGFIVDKILLRKDSSSTAPSGTGPAESPRGGTGNRLPVINSVTPATKSKYFEQDAVTVSVTASDPDGDLLEYQFSVNGTVKRVWGATSTYVLATTDRNYGKRTIDISVRDNRGGTAASSTTIFFYKKPLKP